MGEIVKYLLTMTVLSLLWTTVYSAVPFFGSEKLCLTMLGNERQRAYRYGMTLLCVGVFFNWLSITENNSDPVRFVGFTCLASGALLVCMAICLWANSTRHSNLQVGPERDGNSTNSSDNQREPSHATEKPPDYDSVADNTPPPSYADAILLSPANLPPVVSQPTSSRSGEVQVEIDNTGQPKDEAPAEPSRLSRVLRLSRRLIRRTLSNVEQVDVEASRTPNLIRSVSVQESKPV